MKENDIDENKEEVDTNEDSGKKTRRKKAQKEKTKGQKVVDNVVSLIILIVCIIGLIFSGKQLYKWIMNNIKSNDVMNKVNEIAGVPDIAEDEDPGVEFGINFESLCAYNSDVVGWIRVPKTGINYSLVQSDDNSKYLRHSIDLVWNEFGWPFLDYRNAPDFSDKNTILYGHNIVSGLMFADCSKIYNGALGNDVDIYIYRKDYRMLTYKVFSTYVVSPEMYYLTPNFSSNEAYTEFLNTITSRSVRNFNQTVGVDDTIITLSTCTSDSKGRIVVHAKLVSNTEMPR